MELSRRDVVKATGFAAAAVATSGVSFGSAAFAQGQAFDIDQAFAGFMRDIGGDVADAGGKVTFTGRRPDHPQPLSRRRPAWRSPRWAQALGAAAIWRERTGQEQDLTVDLRESVYNVNPLIGRDPADGRSARAPFPRPIRSRATSSSRRSTA